MQDQFLLFPIKNQDKTLTLEQASSAAFEQVLEPKVFDTTENKKKYLH